MHIRSEFYSSPLSPTYPCNAHRLSKLACLFAPAVFFYAQIACAQQTILVPADQPTIQAGINAANNGDTVLVAPGTYYENIDFQGKAITVTSSGGAAQTILDGSSTGPAVTFETDETLSSTISGFTIQHGGSLSASLGIPYRGSILLQNSTPSILNNIITLSNCLGIDSYYSAPLIQNNTISATQDPYGSCPLGGGSAIFIWGAMTTNQFNHPNGWSGNILGNIIENNVESGLEDGGNGGVGNGGAGIAVWGGPLVIMGNIIRNNASPDATGGAINFLDSQNTLVAQNLIYGNRSGCGGGAIATNGSGLYFMNNTIVDNVRVSTSGASNCADIAQIYPNPESYGADSPSNIFINNIISGSTSFPAVNCSWYNPASESIQPTFQNNILYNAGGPFFGSFCVDVSGKYNNIASDPQFVSPSTGDYHLKSTSPAIDAGQNTVLQTFLSLTGQSLSKDFDGNRRVQDATGKGCAIDIGAYEYPGAQNNCGVFEILTSSLNPAMVGQSITFTVQLSAASGIPTGSVQFLDGTNVLWTQVVSGTGSASFSSSSLAVGSHTITAVYQPTGTFSGTTLSISQVVNGYTTGVALTCLPSPIAVFNTAVLTATVTSAFGQPTGAIAFTDNGAALATQSLTSGATSLTYTGVLAQTHTITATYAPTGSFAPSSTSCSEVVTPLATASVLTVTPSTSTFGSPATLSAAVSPSTLPGPSTPTGTVTFYDGGTALSTANLDSTGHAASTTTALAVGTHLLTAVYAGSAIYATSTSAPFTETILPLPQDFTITLANPSLTLQTQHHLTTTLTLTSLNGLADSLTIACANLPAYVTCRPTPSPATLTANGTATVSLYLDTDSTLGYARNISGPSPLPASPINLVLLLSPFGLLTTLAALARRKPGRRTRLRLLVLAFAALSITLGLSGCGNDISPFALPPSAAPGTYTIPITATAATTGISHTANLTLTVTR